MADLPIVPCYNSDNCGDIFNCGPESSECNVSTTPSIAKNCPSGQTQKYCFGNDPNSCSGINRICPSINVDCALGEANPQLTTYSNYIGCNVETDPNCWEFDNDQTNSNQPSICQSTCWNLGGNLEVDSVCKTLFTDQASCNAMKYFCTWNGYSCEAVGQDPAVIGFPTSPVSTGTVGKDGL